MRILVYVLSFCMLYFSLMMNTQEGGYGYGYGSRSGACAHSIIDQMREFISSKFTCGILEQTPVIFGMIKEGIREILDEHLGAFCPEVMAIIGYHTLSFCELDMVSGYG